VLGTLALLLVGCTRMGRAGASPELIVWTQSSLAKMSAHSPPASDETAREEAGSPLAVRIVSAAAASGVVANPECAVDGDAKTEVTFEWANGGLTLLLRVRQPSVLEAIRVTNGQTAPVIWLKEVAVGPDRSHLRDILSREINLPVRRAGDRAEFPLPPSVGRYVRVSFGGGGAMGSVSEVTLLGHENQPERHLYYLWGNLHRDIMDKLDYLEHELGATDLWLDYVETAFPQTNTNSGFAIWEETGALDEFQERGIRYWLLEHEAFTTMVNGPEDLRNDRKWETTLHRMRDVYARARALGFRGLVLDAEDYGGVRAEATERYKDVADYVDAWCFADEFGYGGLYYQRGLQFGRVLAEVWDCPVLQVYEARMYAGKGDCRAGNYWWLKGIHDAGIEIWIATERTYGAGNSEIADSKSPEYCKRWFVQMAQYIPRVHEAYPFAARVLPGFHPWNTAFAQPNYLPNYLDQQLRIARNCAFGYWIYNRGNEHAGDPKDVLDREFCARYGVAPEDYLEVFKRHPTCRTAR